MRLQYADFIRKGEGLTESPAVKNLLDAEIMYMTVISETDPELTVEVLSGGDPATGTWIAGLVMKADGTAVDSVTENGIYSVPMGGVEWVRVKNESADTTLEVYGSFNDAVRTETDISGETKSALLNCLENVAWATPDGKNYYDALSEAMNPPASLVSISAVYTQTVAVEPIDPLSVLRDDLVVTAHYADHSTEQVYGYTLSGTLAVGTSTVTVTYGDKTASITVTVSPSYLTPGRTYTLNSMDIWRMAKGMSYIWENDGKSYDSLITDNAGTWAMTYLFPVAPGGITLKWNSNAYKIMPSFWDANECWKYKAFDSNVYLTDSPSSYNAADNASYGVKYFAIGLGRKDDAVLSDADISAANIQLEVL